MKKNIESFSSSSNVGLTSRQFFLPSVTQLLLYVLMSVLVLAVFNAKNAWDYLDSSVIAPQGGLGKILPQRSPEVNRFLNSFSHSIFLQVVFWVAVGCVVYLIIWFLRNIMINILNDIAAGQYVHPKSYKGVNFWGSVLTRKIYLGISIVILIIYTGSFIKLLINLSNFCYGLISDFHPAKSILELLGATAVTAVLIYFLILLVKIVVHSWRSIYHDL